MFKFLWGGKGRSRDCEQMLESRRFSSTHDGEKTRYGDPYAMWRALTQDPEINLERIAPEVDEGREPETSQFLGLIRKVFAVKTFERRSGTGLDRLANAGPGQPPAGVHGRSKKKFQFWADLAAEYGTRSLRLARAPERTYECLWGLHLNAGRVGIRKSYHVMQGVAGRIGVAFGAPADSREVLCGPVRRPGGSQGHG